MPEKFWQADKGAINTDALLQSYRELEGKLGNAAKEAREAYERERLAKRPEKPEAYAFAPTEGMVPSDLVIMDKAPEGDFAPEEGKTYFVMNPNDPMLAFWRDHCHRTGLGQDEFSAGIVAFAKAMGERAPTAAEKQADLQQRLAALGPDGAQRATAMHGQLRSLLGEQDATALDAGITTPEAFRALERVMSLVNGARFAPPDAGTYGNSAALTEADLIAKKAKAYGMPYGPERDRLLAEVTEGYKRLFPTR